MLGFFWQDAWVPATGFLRRWGQDMHDGAWGALKNKVASRSFLRTYRSWWFHALVKGDWYLSPLDYNAITEFLLLSRWNTYSWFFRKKRESTSARSTLMGSRLPDTDGMISFESIWSRCKCLVPYLVFGCLPSIRVQINYWFDHRFIRHKLGISWPHPAMHLAIWSWRSSTPQGNASDLLSADPVWVLGCRRQWVQFQSSVRLVRLLVHDLIWHNVNQVEKNAGNRENHWYWY